MRKLVDFVNSIFKIFKNAHLSLSIKTLSSFTHTYIYIYVPLFQSFKDRVIFFNNNKYYVPKAPTTWKHVISLNLLINLRNRNVGFKSYKNKT